LCLVLVGLVYARPIYRMNLLTIGDFYRQKYGPAVELVSSIFLVLSFLGWVAGQFVALGVLFHVVLGLPPSVGMLLGFGIVVGYTLWGGMWSVAVLDFVQNAVLIAGLLVVATFLVRDWDWRAAQAALPPDYF